MGSTCCLCYQDAFTLKLGVSSERKAASLTIPCSIYTETLAISAVTTNQVSVADSLLFSIKI